MAILDLSSKEMELVLRLYLDRCDRKLLIWWYYDDGTGLKVKALDKKEIKTITLADLINFFNRNPKVVRDRERSVVVYQNSSETHQNQS